MQKKMKRIKKAFETPGTADSSAMMIWFSDLIRLKRRKTRNARSSLSLLMLPRSTPVISRIPTATMMKSKTFHPLRQNAPPKPKPYMLTSSSIKKR
eukprot:jgi/Chrpa1/6273/Chrysochromulina_OHIO_Genome00002122-RA